MTITLDEKYNAKTDIATLGYVGETNARIITFVGYQCDGADSYKMRFKYSDGIVYDVDISGGTYTIDGSILRCVGTVHAQILACKQNGDSYEYVKKSDILTLHIGRSLNGEVAPVPTYEQSVETLEKVLAAEKSTAENVQKSETASNAAQAAQNAAETAKETAEELAANAEKAADNAAQSETAAQTAADIATSKAAEISDSAEQIQQNTSDIAKLYSKSDGIVCETEGTKITLNDSSELPFSGMRVFGRSEQDGTPSPDNPVPIVSVGDNNQIIVTVSDNADDVQTLTLSTPNGLHGIPVASGGNYTDENGQQWICDEINFERGVYVQRILAETLTNFSRVSYETENMYSYQATLSQKAYGGSKYIALGDKLVYAYNRGDTQHFYVNNNTNIIDVFLPKSMVVTTFELAILVALSEPCETSLSDDEITAYKFLHTNKPTTVITNSDSAHMAVSYTADTKTYIDNKFAELQAAIISTGGNV